MDDNRLEEAVRKGLDDHVRVYGDEIFPTENLVMRIANAIKQAERDEASTRFNASLKRLNESGLKIQDGDVLHTDETSE